LHSVFRTHLRNYSRLEIKPTSLSFNLARACSMFSPITNSKASGTANFTADRHCKTSPLFHHAQHFGWNCLVCKNSKLCLPTKWFRLKKWPLERNACETKSAFLYQIISWQKPTTFSAVIVLGPDHFRCTLL